jgi:hypothetical protein
LRSYSLVSYTTAKTTFEMHRLVQVATKKWLRAANQFDLWASRFISNLEEAFPTSDFHNWATCRSLFPQAIAAMDVKVTKRTVVLRQASLLLRSGQYASAQGAYADGERMEKGSLDARREVLGKGHPDTLTSMNNLAATYSQ